MNLPPQIGQLTIPAPLERLKGATYKLVTCACGGTERRKVSDLKLALRSGFNSACANCRKQRGRPRTERD